MNNNSNNLTRGEKILLFLYEFGQGKKTRVRYEDIVIGVFKKFPTDFHLKGYPAYPDSGDLIHKPLYDFKKKGYVNAENKVFSLTDRGIEFAEQLSKKDRGSSVGVGDRLSRSTETEFARVKGSEGFALFVESKKESLSDNDFYNYLGVTVRTQKNAFIGRLNTMEAVVDELKKRDGDPLSSKIVAYHDYMMGRYKNIVDFFMQN